MGFSERLIISSFGSSEPLHMLGLMGVSAPSLHIDSTDSMDLISLFRFVFEYARKIPDLSVKSLYHVFIRQLMISLDLL